MGILVWVAGCVIHEPATIATEDGAVEVAWEVGASGCEAAGVATVEVSIGDAIGTFPCSDGGATLEVPPGDHFVLLDGIDAQGQVRYGGEGEITVGPGEVVAVPTIVLSALPADLTVTWYFDNGRLCGQNGVELVDVRVFQDDYVVGEAEAHCDDGEATVEALVAGRYDVSVLARDGQGVATHGATEVVDLGKGDHVVVEIELLAE